MNLGTLLIRLYQNGFMAPPVESHISRTAPEGGASSLGVSSDPYGLNDEEDTEPIRRWREEQEEEIARREANAERRKAETISKAEQDIDNFYAEYNKKKEKNISSNKYVIPHTCCGTNSMALF